MAPTGSIFNAMLQEFDEAARICQRELELLTETETYATRVRRLLLEKQQGGFPNLAVSYQNGSLATLDSWGVSARH